jgi:flotillin
MFVLVAAAAAVLVFFIMFMMIVSRYKKCRSDQILVIYGRVGKGQSSKCIHGGAAFVWPMVQDYQYMSLSPIQINIPLENALSKQNIRVAVPSIFTIGISTETDKMSLAAERLLNMDQAGIEQLAKEIIIGQLRQVVVTMDIEEINADRDKFLKAISMNVETELEKVGLRLINVNITDIKDESGYLAALGKNSAAEAINRAKVQVAEKDRDGSVGEAKALQDKRIQVANADATAVEGENKAKVLVANSNSEMKQKSAEANKMAVAAEKVQAAKALQEAYAAEQAAEEARAKREQATKTADLVVSANSQKEQIRIAAEAQNIKLTEEAKGEANATFAKMDAQARGLCEILTKQAEGLKLIVAAAGGDAKAAATLLIIDKLPQIVEKQVEAIKGIKFDKVTVWDGGNKDGKSSTANFMSGLLSVLPQLKEILAMGGMDLPEILGKSAAGSAGVPTADPSVTVAAEKKPEKRTL